MARTATLRERSAGRLVEIAGYEHLRRSDDSQVRREKSKKTSEVMRKYNQKTSEQLFALKLAANFDRGDIVGCVTYDDAHLPQTRAEANTRFRCFRDRVRREWTRRGLDPAQLVFAWSTEHVHGEGRWHHHFVCTAAGDDFKMLRKAWIYGSVDEFSALRVDTEKGYDSLAHYFAKEAREKLGLRSWSFSRNARKPVENIYLLESDTMVDPPPGVTVLERHVTETIFGKFFYLKYLMPYAKTKLPERRHSGGGQT